MRRHKTRWHETDAADDEGGEDDVPTPEANRLAGSTMISLGYHREGVGVNSKDAEKTNQVGFSDAGVTVASAAFVLAGVALSTIPAVLL